MLLGGKGAGEAIEGEAVYKVKAVKAPKAPKAAKHAGEAVDGEAVYKVKAVKAPKAPKAAKHAGEAVDGEAVYKVKAVKAPKAPKAAKHAGEAIDGEAVGKHHKGRMLLGGKGAAGESLPALKTKAEHKAAWETTKAEFAGKKVSEAAEAGTGKHHKGRMLLGGKGAGEAGGKHGAGESLAPTKTKAEHKAAWETTKAEFEAKKAAGAAEAGAGKHHKGRSLLGGVKTADGEAHFNGVSVVVPPKKTLTQYKTEWGVAMVEYKKAIAEKKVADAEKAAAAAEAGTGKHHKGRMLLGGRGGDGESLRATVPPAITLKQHKA